MMHPTIRRVLRHPYFLILLAALLLYSLMGFIIVPGIIRWYAPSFARNRLHLQMDVGSLRINPFLLTVDIRNVRIREAGGTPLIEFSRFYADAETSSLRHWTLTFREIRLESPTLHVLIHSDGSTNLSQLSGPSAEPSHSPETTPFRMIFQQAAVEGGTVLLTDQRQHTPAELTLRNITVHLADVSTLPNRTGACSLEAATSANETLRCDGRISLAPVSFTGKLAVGSLQINTLWAFIRDSLALTPPEGKLDAATDCHMDNSNMSFDNFRLGVSGLSLKLAGADKPLFQVGTIAAGPALIDITQRRIHVQQLGLENGALHIETDSAGRLNLTQMAANGRKAPESSAKISGKPSPPTDTIHKSENSPPWAIIADGVDIRNIAVDVSDASKLKPVHAQIASLGIHFRADITAGGYKSRTVLHELSTRLDRVSIGNMASAKPLFSTRQISLDGGEADVSAHSVSISQIALNDGDVNFSLDRQGRNNWQQFLTPGKSVKHPSAPHQEKPGKPWTYRIQTLKLNKFRSDFSDLSVKPGNPVVNIQDCYASLSPIDGKSPIGVDLTFRLKQGGAIKIRGKVKTAGHPEIAADIMAHTVSLTPLQPYMEPYVALKLKSALASLKGAFHYGSRTAGAQIVYAGSASLDHLRLTEPGLAKTFLGWDGLHIPQMKLTLHPDRLDIRNIQLIKPVGEVIIAKNRTVNLTEVLKKQPKPHAVTHPSHSGAKSRDSAFPIRIGTVHIERGDVGFADLSLIPQFMTQITNLRGNISGFSSTGENPSRIRLEGDVDQYGMVNIDGSIAMLNPAKSTDITMIFRNVEMTKLTPYSGKFAGRRITSGKLSMDLKYHIEDNKMIGNNQIIVDNLTLGEHLDSPDAVHLPLDLAIALLRDSNGRIDIGLPVSGDLNDPQFSYGHLIWKALVNVLTKIVTSPFRALGALFGGESQHMDAVVFDPGKSDLLPPEREKLHTLSEMLKKRPQLQLVIQGRYSLDADGKAIKAIEVRQSISQNAGKKWTPEEDMGIPDFSDARNRQSLEKMFKDQYGAAALKTLKQSATEKNAGNKSGKNPSLAEMLYEKLVEGTPLPPEKLIDLADRRSREIAGELEKADGIPPARLNIRPSEAQTEKGAPSVKFSLGAMP